MLGFGLGQRGGPAIRAVGLGQDLDRDEVLARIRIRVAAGWGGVLGGPELNLGLD